MKSYQEDARQISSSVVSVDCEGERSNDNQETMETENKSCDVVGPEGEENFLMSDDNHQRQRPMTVRGADTSIVFTVKKHFKHEFLQFKEERKKDIWEIPREDITLDFEKLFNEWKIVKTDWRRAKEVTESKTFFSEFSFRIVIGFLFTVIPNCLIALDYIAAYEYLSGTFYSKLDNWTNHSESAEECKLKECDNTFSLNCKKINGVEKQRTCFEKDPVFGYLTLALTLSSGFFWSFLMIYKYWTHLRKTKPENFKKKRMFLVFMPIAMLSMITYPLQLLIISLLSCFNDQEQWINLTVKVGIAEGLFNAHFQWLLQTFIFLYQADRQPSTFQLLAAFGSLVFLAYSRVESFMLERGGHRMSPGQKLWWMVRYIPYCVVNCGYKLLSISVILATLRFNAVWIYATVIMIWIFIQILFKLGCLPTRYFYLFQGAGIHAISYTHIPEWIKFIEAKKNPKDNNLWVTKLSLCEIHRNIIFQNTLYSVLNTVGLSTIWILSRQLPSHDFQIFWPFTPDLTYKLEDIAVFQWIDIMVPILILFGFILMFWIFYEERNWREKTVKHLEFDDFPQYPGWKLYTCSVRGDGWHQYKVDEDLDDGLQGCINQMFYPVVNIWESLIDKSLY